MMVLCIYYSSNCGRHVPVPPWTDPEHYQFRQENAQLNRFQHPQWWTMPYGYLDFVPLIPKFSGVVFECLRDIMPYNVCPSEEHVGRFVLRPEKAAQWQDLEDLLILVSALTFLHSPCCPSSNEKNTWLVCSLDGPNFISPWLFWKQLHYHWHSPMVFLSRISGDCTVMAQWAAVIHSMRFFEVLPTCGSISRLPWEWKAQPTPGKVVYFFECSSLVPMDRQTLKGSQRETTTCIPSASPRTPTSCYHNLDPSSHFNSTFDSFTTFAIFTTSTLWTTFNALSSW